MLYPKVSRSRVGIWIDGPTPQSPHCPTRSDGGQVTGGGGLMLYCNGGAFYTFGPEVEEEGETYLLKAKLGGLFLY